MLKTFVWIEKKMLLKECTKSLSIHLIKQIMTGKLRLEELLIWSDCRLKLFDCSINYTWTCPIVSRLSSCEDVFKYFLNSPCLQLHVPQNVIWTARYAVRKNAVQLAHHLFCEHSDLSFLLSFRSAQCLVGNICGKCE